MTNDNNVGITFRETMRGGFIMGETDPRAGERKGNDAGSKLSMHAAVSIRDMNRFISEPDHAGEITGEIDFAPLGEHMAATAGTFNLFSPTDDPKLKFMIYEMAFQHAGKDYYLAGKKEVRNDPGFDLWTDTTTLYTKLHEGTDTAGPVVGAGVLSLGPADLTKLVLSMRVTNSSSAKEQAEAVANFGRFFMGELWDSYALKIITAPWWRQWWRRLFG